MPVCFQLYRKGQSEPVRFIDVDDEMCKHFEVEPHETEYYLGWYDFVGLRLALGFTWAEIAQENADMIEHCIDMAVTNKAYASSILRCEKRAEAIEWLRQNFTSDNWREIGRVG